MVLPKRVPEVLRQARDWWSVLATFGILPTIGVTIAMLFSVLTPIEIAMCVLGVLGYWIVLVIEVTPYVDAIGPRDRPRLEFMKTADGTLPGGWSMPVMVTEVWFRNTPRVPTEQSEAKSVTASVVIDLANGNQLEFIGSWLLSDAPTNIGFVDISTEVDLPPNAVPSKLGIAARRPHEDDAYGMLPDTIHREFQHPDYAIGRGEHRVTVTVTGIWLRRQTFYFSLLNEGRGGALRLTTIRATDTTGSAR